jgi:hypothetical protein
MSAVRSDSDLRYASAVLTRRLLALAVALTSLSCTAGPRALPQAERQRQIEELSALWSFYRFRVWIRSGQTWNAASADAFAAR